MPHLLWHSFWVMDEQSIETPERREERLRGWAERLAQSVEKVMSRNPEADPDNVRHALILLECPPLERLRRSLIRGRSAAQRE